MNTITERNRSFVWGLIAALILLMAVLSTVACVGAPRSAEQFQEMPQEKYDAWLVRVGAWARVAAAQVAHDSPGSVENVREYAGLVRTLAGSEDPLGDAASQAGLVSPLIDLLVLEAKALLDARGGLPGGARLVQFLDAVAGGVEAGLPPSERKGGQS